MQNKLFLWYSLLFLGFQGFCLVLWGLQFGARSSLLSWWAFVLSIQYENFMGFPPLSSQILLKSIICKVKRPPFSKHLWGRSISLCILSQAKADSKPGDERMMLYWFSACYLLHHCIPCRKNRIILAQIRGSFPVCLCLKTNSRLLVFISLNNKWRSRSVWLWIQANLSVS